jgi:uncharacterized protein (TIGR00299 family) protein
VSGRTVAWFHCFAGIAGDMALGSLLDAGADLAEVRRMLDQLPLRGWSLEAEPVVRGGIAATHAVVRVTDGRVVRTYAHLASLVEEARLPPRVRDRSLKVLAALAGAEARLHRRPVAQVHFHEVGGEDALIDVVGTCAALEALEVDAVTASPVAVGTGVVRSSHGILPNPAPAVVELLRGVPIEGRNLNVELTTPTGAAILAGLSEAFGPLPAMEVRRAGFGAGTRDLGELPNLTRVVVGTVAVEDELPGGEPATLIEANVDDATGEVLARAVARLLAAGALDAWVVPVVMKKGRPGHVVCALAEPASAAALRAVMAHETGSLGTRATAVERWPLARTAGFVELEGHRVRVKVAAGRVKVEHDDAVRVAETTGLSLREVLFRAEALWRAESEARPGGGPTTEARPGGGPTTGTGGGPDGPGGQQA